VRLECHGFGKLVGASVVFGPGLNLVFGPNEAGKSTLVDAILAGLYGLKGRTSFFQHLRELRSPWQAGAPYAVTVTFTTREGEEMLVHRDLREGRAQVWQKTASGLLPVDETVLEQALAALGAPSAPLFTSAFLVRQQEVAALDRKTLGQALVEKVTAGEAAVTAREALRRLERRRQELVRGGERQPGLLVQARDRLRRCHESLERDRQTAGRYHDALAQSHQLAVDRDALRAELDRLLPLVTGYERLQEAQRALAERQEELDREAGRLEKCRRLQRELAAVTEEVAALTVGDRYASWQERTGETLEGLERSLEGLRQQLGAARAGVAEREERLNAVTAQLEMVREELGRVDPEGSGPSVLDRAEELAREQEQCLRQAEDRQAQAELLAPRASLAHWCFRGFLATVALAVLGTWGWLSGLRWALWGAVGTVSLAGILLGGYLRLMGDLRHRELLAQEAAHFQRQARELEQRLGRLAGGGTLADLRERARRVFELTARLSELERSRGALELALEMSGLAALEEAVGRRQQLMAQLLGELGVQDVEEARALIVRHRDLVRTKEVLSAELAGLLGQAQPEDLARITDRLAGEVAALRSQRDAVRGELRVDLKPDEYVGYAARREELEGRLAETTAALERLDERIRVLRGELTEGDPWELAARADAEAQLIAQLEREAAALELAEQALSEAAEEAQRMVAPALQERAGSLLARLTGGRYREIAVEVQEGELGVRVRSPETQAMVSDAALSTGTRDQLYLALRMALAEYLSGSPDAPLILDDAFVHYDAGRLANAAAAMTELARARQVIWVTKDEELTRLLPDASVIRIDRVGGVS